MKSHYRAAAGTVIFDLIRSFARRSNFSPARIFFDDAKMFTKKVQVVAIEFVQETSKSERSSRFLSRLKFETFARHFLANSADHPGIWANLITIRPNPGTIGRIHQKVASAFFVIGTKEMSCSQHKECPASNTRNVLLRKECPDWNARNVMLRTSGMSCVEHKERPASNTRNVLLGNDQMSYARTRNFLRGNGEFLAFVAE